MYDCLCLATDASVINASNLRLVYSLTCQGPMRPAMSLHQSLLCFPMEPSEKMLATV
jgi:hypothetical protein